MIVYWSAKTCVKLMVKLFYHHKVYGKEHFPKGGGIIASNHCSFLDPPLIGVSCPGTVHFLARESLFRSKAFGWLLRKLCTHPVAKGKGNIDTLRKAVALVEAGNKVVIFPEGSRSLTGELQPGLHGVGMLVLRTHSLVIPAYVHGTFEIWNAERSFPKLVGKTACVFGMPLDFSHIPITDKKRTQVDIVDGIMHKILSLKEWYLDGAKGSPP